MTATTPWRLTFGGADRAAFAYGMVLVALPVLAIYSFESLAFLICLAGAVTLDAARFGAIGDALRRRGPAQALAAFALWLMVSALWADAPGASLGKAAGIAAEWGAGLAFVLAAQALSPERLRLVAIFLVGAVLVMLTAYGVELTTDAAFATFVKHVRAGPDLSPETVPLVALVKIERGVTVLVCLAWLAVLAAARITGKTFIGAALFVAIAAVTALMPNSASLVALSGATLVFAAALLWPRFIGIVVTGVLSFITLTLPWLVRLLPQAGEADRIAGALKFSALHRLEIYRYVASLIAERPLFGWGFDAARTLSRTAPVAVIDGRSVPLISLHPHDAVLQVWLETGAVGAALLAAFIVALGRALLAASWPRPVKAAAWATITATAAISSLSFGIWQYHWQAVMLIVVALLTVLARPHAQ